jgi:hypothetical protein
MVLERFAPGAFGFGIGRPMAWRAIVSQRIHKEWGTPNPPLAKNARSGAPGGDYRGKFFFYGIPNDLVVNSTVTHAAVGSRSS